MQSWKKQLAELKKGNYKSFQLKKLIKKNDEMRKKITSHEKSKAQIQNTLAKKDKKLTEIKSKFSELR